jgi:hypothetical protein
LKSTAEAAQATSIHTKFPIVVKIGIVGNDVSIHHIVGAYVCLRREQPALFNDITLQFYLLPVGTLVQNQFASFLSRYDRWYYRHQWLGHKAYCSTLPCVDVPSFSAATALVTTKTTKDDQVITPKRVSMSHIKPGGTLRGTYVDNDRMSLASLIESIKEVQKQKQEASSFLKPEADNSSNHTTTIAVTTTPPPQNNSNNDNNGDNGSTATATNAAATTNPTTTTTTTTTTTLNGKKPNRLSLNPFFNKPAAAPETKSPVNGRPKLNLTKGGILPAEGLPPKPAPLTRPLPVVSPARLLRNEVEHYFREAKHPLRVKVFQCECFSLFGDEVFHYTIPFVTKVEMGINASIRAFQEANDLPLTLSANDIMTNKLFKYFPINITTRYVPVSPIGNARPPLSTDLRTYTTFTLTNVGNTADRVHPNPVRPWLEMCTLESDTKKKKGREEAVNIAMVEVESEDKKKLMDVIIDGELYGPVYRIRISACASSAESDAPQLEFPVMTYLPIDLP